MGPVFVRGAGREADASPLELAVWALLVVVPVALFVFARFGSDPAAPPAETRTAEPPTPSASSAPEPQVVEAPPDSLLPAGSCGTDDARTVVCTDPVAHIAEVRIQTYASSEELYAAYVQDVEALTGRPFRGNVGDCSGRSSEGEVSWSLDRSKSRAFPLRLLRDGLVDPMTEAAGRVFCTSTGGDATIIWTQDPFRLVTATGAPADLVAKWWVDAHMQLACGEGSAYCPS